MRTRKSQLSISTAVSVVIVVVIVAIAAIAAGFYFISPASTAPSKVCPYTSGQNVPIIFGATLSLTGSLSAFGQEQNWTLYQAVHDINSFGGIPLCNGAKGTVSLKVLDDGTDPAKASQNLQTLVSTDHAVVILGELGGVQDSTAQTFASQNKIPYVDQYTYRLTSLAPQTAMILGFLLHFKTRQMKLTYFLTGSTVLSLRPMRVTVSLPSLGKGTRLHLQTIKQEKHTPNS